MSQTRNDVRPQWLPYLWCVIIAIGVLQPATVGRLSAAEQTAGTDLYGDPLPAGVAVRLGTVRYRSPAKVSGLGFADDNQSLIFTSGGGVVAVIDAATGRTVRTFDTGQPKASLWLNSNRHTIVTIGAGLPGPRGRGETVARSWNVTTGMLLSQTSAIDVSGRAEFDTSHDGSTLVVGSEDGTIRCWDLIKGNQLRVTRLAKPRLTSVAISPDGKLVVASAFNQLFFWDWLTDKDPESIDLGRTVVSLAFSPDGSLLAEGPDSRKDIVLRDVATRKVLHSLSDAEETAQYVRSLAFSPDGKSIAAPNSIGLRGKPPAHRVYVWDTASGAIQHQFSTGDMHPIAITVSGDGHWLAAAVGGLMTGGATIKIWDLRTGMLMGDDLAGHDPYVTTIRFSPDGQSAVTAADDGTARIWDAATGRQKQVLRHDKWVRSAALSPDGRLIASSSLDDTVRLWETTTGKEIHRLPGHGELGGFRAVAFSMDGERIISWGDDFLLRISDTKTGKLMSEQRVHPADAVALGQNPGEMSIKGAVYSADSKRLAIASAAGVALFEVESGKQLNVLPPLAGWMVKMVISSDGSRLVTSTYDGRSEDLSLRHVVCMREFETGKILFEVSIPSQSAGQIVLSDDGRVLAVASRTPNAKISVLDVATGDPIAEFAVPSYDIMALALTPDGKRLAAGLSGGTVLIWDVPKPR